MGQDMARDADRAQMRRGASYKHLKKQLCNILGWECRFDVKWPGDDVGPSDARIIEELRQRLK